MDHALVAWAGDIPIVTRLWAGAILATSVLLSTETVDPLKLIFLPDNIANKWELWRLFTPFVCFGSLNLNVLIDLYYVTQHSCHLEAGFTSPLLYIWLIFVDMTLILIFYFWHGEPAILGHSLLDALLYYWGRKNQDAQFGLMGVIVLPASYYGIFSLALSFLSHGSIQFSNVAGLAVGHVVFYFDEVFEKLHGVNPLQAPWIWFETPVVQLDGEGAQPVQPQGDGIQGR